MNAGILRESGLHWSLNVRDTDIAQVQKKNSNLNRDLNLGPPDLKPGVLLLELSWFN